jgi:hypothetical protein
MNLPKNYIQFQFGRTPPAQFGGASGAITDVNLGHNNTASGWTKNDPISHLPISQAELDILRQRVIDYIDNHATYTWRTGEHRAVAWARRYPDVTVLDATAPSFASLSLLAAASATAQLSWGSALTDGRDAAPKLHLAAFTAEQASITAATVKASVAGSGGAGGCVGKVTVTAAGSTSSYLFGSGALGEAPLADGMAHWFYAAAEDAAGNLSPVRSVGATTLDVTAPTFTSFAVGTPGAASVPLSWTAVTDNADVAPDVVIAAYSIAQAGIAAATLLAATAGSGGCVGKVSVADGKTATGLSFGAGANGEAALSTAVTYYFYAVAQDASGNTSAVLSATATTADSAAPTFAGFATGTPGASSVPLSWTAASDNVDAAPDVLIAAFSSAQAGITAATVAAAASGSGGCVGKALVADGKTTTSLTFGAGAYGESPLASVATFYFYAVARDAAGNLSAVLGATAATVDSGISIAVASAPAGGSQLDATVAALSTGTRPAYNASTGEFAFNGSSQYFRLYDLDTAADTYGKTVRSNVFTLSAWVNRTAGNTASYPFTFRYNIGTDYYPLIWQTTLFMTGGTYVDVAAYLTYGTWQHVAFVYSATDARMYIDGTLRATNAIPNAFATFPTASTGTVGQYMFIGANNGGSTSVQNDYFAGSMKGFRLYPTALVASDVAAICAAGKDSSPVTATSVPLAWPAPLAAGSSNYLAAYLDQATPIAPDVVGYAQPVPLTAALVASGSNAVALAYTASNVGTYAFNNLLPGTAYDFYSIAKSAAGVFASSYSGGTASNVLTAGSFGLSNFAYAPSYTRVYPPVGLTFTGGAVTDLTTSSVVSGAAYGNGTYVVTTGSVLNQGVTLDWRGFRAFDRRAGGGHLTGCDSVWHNAGGVVVSAGSPDFIEIKLPEAIRVSTITIWNSCHTTYQRQPLTFILYAYDTDVNQKVAIGSWNLTQSDYTNMTWVQVSADSLWTGGLDEGDNTTGKYYSRWTSTSGNIVSSTAYKTFRLHITSASGDGMVQLMEWTLNAAMDNVSAAGTAASLSWSAPTVSSALSAQPVVAAYRENYGASNLVACTVAAGKFAFSPTLAGGLSAGTTYKFDVSDATNAGQQLAFASLSSAGAGSFPPVALSANTQTITGQADGNGEYAITADNAITGTNYLYLFTAASNLWSALAAWNKTSVVPIAVTLTLPLKVNVTGYTMSARSDFAQYPKAWTVAFYCDATLVATDTRSTAAFATAATNAFTFAASAVNKAVVTFTDYDFAGNVFTVGGFRLLGTSVTALSSNTSLTGTPGSPGASVTFVPRAVRTAYSYSAGSGGSGSDYGYGSAIPVLPAVTSLQAYGGAAPSGGALVFASRAVVAAAGVTTSVANVTVGGSSTYSGTALSPISELIKNNTITKIKVQVTGGNSGIFNFLFSPDVNKNDVTHNSSFSAATNYVQFYTNWPGHQGGANWLTGVSSPNTTFADGYAYLNPGATNGAGGPNGNQTFTFTFDRTQRPSYLYVESDAYTFSGGKNYIKMEFAYASNSLYNGDMYFKMNGHAAAYTAAITSWQYGLSTTPASPIFTPTTSLTFGSPSALAPTYDLTTYPGFIPTFSGTAGFSMAQLDPGNTVSTALKTGVFTLSFWVKMKYVSAQTSVMQFADASNAHTIAVFTNINNYINVLGITGITSATKPDMYSAWHLMTWTAASAGATAYFYLDGAAQNGTAASIASYLAGWTPAKMLFGQVVGGSVGALYAESGTQLAKLGVWSRALSAAEVATLYSYGATGPDGAMGDLALEPGADYHFYGIQKHPTYGVLSPVPSQAYVRTLYPAVSGLGATLVTDSSSAFWSSAPTGVATLRSYKNTGTNVNNYVFGASEFTNAAAGVYGYSLSVNAGVAATPGSYTDSSALTGNAAAWAGGLAGWSAGEINTAWRTAAIAAMTAYGLIWNVGTATVTSTTASLKWTSPSVFASASNALILAAYSAAQTGLTPAALVAGTVGAAATALDFTSKSWALAGGSKGVSAGSISITNTVVDPTTGYVYVGYADNAASLKGTVKKFDGSTWSTVGSAGFTAETLDYMSLAIDSSGTLYFGGKYAISNKANVYKYASGAWALVGSANFSSGHVNYVSLKIDASGTPYIAFGDGTYSNKATVMKYTAGAWALVGTAGFSAGATQFMSLEMDSAGTPYVVFMDSSMYATCMKYTSGAWALVGARNFTSLQAFYTHLAIDASGAVYVTYLGTDGSNKAHVMKYSSGAWAEIGPASGFSAGRADYTRIALDSAGTPFVSYVDGGNSNKATVMKYSAGAWSVVGTAGLSGGTSTDVSMALDSVNAKLYVAYSDSTATVANALSVHTIAGTGGGYAAPLCKAIVTGSAVSGTTIVEFPPAPLTANTQTLSGYSYGNGAYALSTTLVTYTGYGAFNLTSADLSFASSFWAPNPAYSTNGGNGTQTFDIVYQLPSAIQITSYKMGNNNDPVQLPTSWTLYGSNDGAAWTSIDTQSAQVFVINVLKAFTVTGAAKYSRFKFTMLNANTGGGNNASAIVIGYLGLFGYGSEATSYALGAGTFGDAALASGSTCYVYGAARSRYGVLSSIVSGPVAVTTAVSYVTASYAAGTPLAVTASAANNWSASTYAVSNFSGVLFSGSTPSGITTSSPYTVILPFKRSASGTSVTQPQIYIYISATQSIRLGWLGDDRKLTIVDDVNTLSVLSAIDDASYTAGASSTMYNMMVCTWNGTTATLRLMSPAGVFLGASVSLADAAFGLTGVRVYMGTGNSFISGYYVRPPYVYSGLVSDASLSAFATDLNGTTLPSVPAMSAYSTAGNRTTPPWTTFTSWSAQADGSLVTTANTNSFMTVVPLGAYASTFTFYRVVKLSDTSVIATNLHKEQDTYLNTYAGTTLAKSVYQDSSAYRMTYSATTKGYDNAATAVTATGPAIANNFSTAYRIKSVTQDAVAKTITTSYFDIGNPVPIYTSTISLAANGVVAEAAGLNLGLVEQYWCETTHTLSYRSYRYVPGVAMSAAQIAADYNKNPLTYLYITGVNSSLANSEIVVNGGGGGFAAVSLSSAASMGGTGNYYTLTVTFSAKAIAGKTSSSMTANCLVAGVAVGSVVANSTNGYVPQAGANYTFASITVAAASAVQFQLASVSDFYSAWNVTAKWVPV